MSSGIATTDLFNMIVMKNFIFRKRNIRRSSGTATTYLFNIKAESLKLGIRFSTPDFMNSFDSVAGMVSRCSSPILRELSGSSVDKTGSSVHLNTAASDPPSLGYSILEQGIEVDKAKIEVILKLPHPTTIKGIRSFLGHAGFYRRFIKDFSKISRPMTHLLEKNSPFIFSNECIQAFRTLKDKLTKAPILIAPNWDQSFELMCDASDYIVGAVLGQRIEKHFCPIHYASKIMNQAEANYTTTVKEMLAVAHKDASTPWFADLANYHAGNLIIKGPALIKLFDVVWLERNLLTSLMLVIVDPLGDTMKPTTQRRKFLTQPYPATRFNTQEKHIAVRYHFIKEHVEKGTIELYFVKKDYQLADLFTKALPADRFNYLVHHLGMRNLSPQELERLAKS
nr:reverse transcriptase domain-containing protein [Tanacetum cinerariifolium]